MTAPPPPSPGPVLLFDAACPLCRRAVRGLIRRDPRGRLRFAPLASPAARAVLSAHGLPADDPDSLVFVPDWAQRLSAPVHLRSTGALRAAAVLGGPWRLAALLHLIPARWRDAAYHHIAARRARDPAAAARVEFSPAEADRLLAPAPAAPSRPAP